MRKEGRLSVAAKKPPLFSTFPTIDYRGRRYYLWMEGGALTMKRVRESAQRAIKQGYNVHITKQKLTPGALVYTNPKFGTLTR